MTDTVYRERAALVALLAAQYPAVIVSDGDPQTPGWSLIYVDTPHGQMSWHLSPDDLDLFAHVPTVDDGPTWDGHTTEEKYQRLAALTAEVAATGTPLMRSAHGDPQVVRPGDTLILRSKAVITAETAAKLKADVAHRMPGVDAAIFAGIEQLAVYRPDTE